MEPVSALRRREVETYFNVIAKGGTERLLRARSFHNLGEWAHDDYEALAGVFARSNAHCSFSFLGRDADRYADTIGMLHDAGHEIVFHGHRHVGCATIDRELAHENIDRGLEAIDAAAGIRPRGFIAPRQTVNEATLGVLDDFGFEWVLGRTDAAVPPSLSFAEPAYPYDLIVLNEGADPPETFERMRVQATEGSAMLFHSNMLEYYDGLDEYVAWIDETEPVSIGEWFANGGVGVINDAMRPLRIV